jgi:hypothetical protein
MMATVASEVWMRPCALDAMPAALEAQVLEHVIAGDAEDGFLESALFAAAEGDILDLPAFVAGIMGVHVVKVAGKQGSLVAAGAGADFDDDAAVVLAFAEQQILKPSVQSIAPGAQLLQLVLNERPHLSVGVRT